MDEPVKVKTIQDALDICQRNLDKGYINDPYNSGDDDFFKSGYGSCLKDVANLLLGDDNDYGVKDNT